jgi:LuxR family transcriptional regulator, maltose regulon positive regulatory protein
MPIPILATKLFIPLPRPELVVRPRLLQRLDAGLSRGLTLVSASAGFGKTSLLSAWLARGSLPAAWLSLDEADSEPNRFLFYLLAALRTLQPGLGEAALAALNASPPPPVESLLTGLLNELSALPAELILVLDDYHTIDSREVDALLAFLVDHLPRALRLVIASREDPALPLARLRARGQLSELRALDLRFTPEEAAEFLQRMGLDLTAQEVEALETRTEGWIAGLQLAALSLQSRQDTAAFIQAFTGSHRFVLDYLVEEVLRHQPEAVREFLLQTAILGRFCAPLCDALTQRADGREMLEILERGNLFLVPLDERREWFRYHHLFAEVLQAHLREERPGLLAALHSRASLWFEQQALPAEAIQHALEAPDFERAANLVESVWLTMDLTYQSAAWLRWVRALPEAAIRARPVLSAGCGWALLGMGDTQACETYLHDAERWLSPDLSPRDAAGMIVVDQAEFRALPASIAAARAYRALTLGDIPATKQYARRVLELAPKDETPHRTQAIALLGLAEYASGDLRAAEQELLKFQTVMWQANDAANAISITFVLASIKLVQGRLRETASDFRQALRQAASLGATSFLGFSDLYRGLSELLCEQGELEAAAQHLRTAEELGQQGWLTGWPHRLCAAKARLRVASGDLEGALLLLEEAERLYIRNPLPERQIAALKTQTLVRLGRLDEARRWVEEQSISPDDDLSFMREFEHLTLARLLLAGTGSGPHAAMDLLERLAQAAEAGGRYGTLIEIQILRALALQAAGDQPRALATLQHAFTLAEPEGYVRLFLDEGQALRPLLEKASREAGGYAARLLAVLSGQPAAVPSASHPSHSDLLEPLSERELDVLRLLRSELSGPEIAQELLVSLNTLRTHTKNIFSKLGVNNRRAAVRRAQDLGLL